MLKEIEAQRDEEKGKSEIHGYTVEEQQSWVLDLDPSAISSAPSVPFNIMGKKTSEMTFSPRIL